MLEESKYTRRGNDGVVLVVDDDEGPKDVAGVLELGELQLGVGLVAAWGRCKGSIASDLQTPNILHQTLNIEFPPHAE